MTLLYDNEGVDNLLSPADQGAGELFHFRNTTGCEGLNQFVQLLGSSIVSAVVIEVHNVILEVPCLFQIGMNGFDQFFDFVIVNIPEIPGPSFRTFKAIDPERQGRAEIIGLFRHRSPAFRICKATFLRAKPGLSYSKPGVVVYLVC